MSEQIKNDPAKSADQAPDAAKADDKADPSAALKAELKAKEERLAKLEADAKKREADERKAADAKAIEEGKAKELLVQREKELAADRERLAAFEKREKEIAKTLFEKLPEAEQEKAKILEAKLSVSDWTDYLRASLSASGSSTEVAPPSGTPGKSANPRKLRELHPDTTELLGQIYADDTVYRTGRHLDVVDTSDGKKFTLNPARFVKLLRSRAQMGQKAAWNTEAVDQAFGAP